MILYKKKASLISETNNFINLHPITRTCQISTSYFIFRKSYFEHLTSHIVHIKAPFPYLASGVKNLMKDPFQSLYHRAAGLFVFRLFSDMKARSCIRHLHWFYPTPMLYPTYQLLPG